MKLLVYLLRKEDGHFQNVDFYEEKLYMVEIV